MRSPHAGRQGRPRIASRVRRQAPAQPPRTKGTPAPDAMRAQPAAVLSVSIIIDLELLPKLRHPLSITVGERGGELLLDLGPAPILATAAPGDGGLRLVEVEVVRTAHATGRASPRPEGSRRARRRAALTRSRSVTTT